jgi:hypothetical protein
MTTLHLDIEVEKEISLSAWEKQKLNYLVQKVFDEYFEDLQDTALSQQIMNSSEIDDLLSKIK